MLSDSSFEGAGMAFALLGAVFSSFSPREVLIHISLTAGQGEAAMEESLGFQPLPLSCPAGTIPVACPLLLAIAIFTPLLETED